uniref:Addiction module component n=1 Tax=Candidatus Kentrum sp. LPFa TaxID=2126335 RepID=A0A450WTJ8_9GAMM|nr:MAG: Putative addiction module component [Candidatus Kentron sp. LPFa]
MTALTVQSYEAALNIPPDDRLVPIERPLGEEVDLPTRDDIDQAWSEEVERRRRELDSGRAKLIPGEEVFEKIKRRFST